MALKLGQRVKILPHDAAKTGDGFPVKRYAGKKGEIVQIGKDGHVTCPEGAEAMVLVDDQIVDGKAQGSCTMREWFAPADLEVG